MIPTTTDHGSFLASWEVIDPMAAFRLKELRVGIALIGRTGASLPGIIQIATGRGPFYSSAAASQPSATLPVPRFIPHATPHGVVWG